jgi:diguanylate cyclase (GGDEF)-like protein
MLRHLLRRFGVARLVFGLTVISVVLSVLITTLIILATGGDGPGVTGLTIAIVAPLVIAPVMSLQMLMLLNRLDQAETRLQALSITDDLTQVFNRRYFISLAEMELARVRRYGGLSSLAILDLDNFKEINDTLGHLAGDEVLRGFAAASRQSLRGGDTFARYGGDEFILLLPNTSAAVAADVVARIRHSLPALPAGAPVNGHGTGRAFSAGIATLSQDTASLDDIIKHADEALYAAKRAGGDEVVDQAR